MLIGKSSVLAANYFPAIDLSDGDYELGLAIFETYTEHERTTNFISSETMEITIPEDSYKVRE